MEKLGFMDLSKDRKCITHTVEVISALILILTVVNFIVMMIPESNTYGDGHRDVGSESDYLKDILINSLQKDGILTYYLSHGNISGVITYLDATFPTDICFNIYIFNSSAEWCIYFYKDPVDESGSVNVIFTSNNMTIYDVTTGENITLRPGIYTMHLIYWYEPRDLQGMLATMGNAPKLDIGGGDDRDGDGVPDIYDEFPLDPSEWLDTDNDGIGNNADMDDDNDGVIDTRDRAPLDPKIGGEEVAENQPLVIPEEAKVTSAAVSISIICIAVIISTEAGKYGAFKFLSPMMIPMFTRICREDVLNNKIRREIYQTIKNNPGISFSELMERLNLKNGTLLYHISTLEREDLIKSKRDGIYRRFYPYFVRLPKKDITKLYGIQRDIVDYIFKHPGCTQTEISSALGLQRQHVHYHIKILIDCDILKAEDGRKYRALYLTDHAERIWAMNNDT